jgi:hypothetical protein
MLAQPRALDIYEVMALGEKVAYQCAFQNRQAPLDLLPGAVERERRQGLPAYLDFASRMCCISRRLFSCPFNRRRLLLALPT